MRREGARRQKNDRKTVLYAYPLHRGSFLQDTLHQQVLVTNKDRLLQRTYFFRSLLGWIGAPRSRRARSVRRAWPQSPPKLPLQILYRAPSGLSFLSELNETFFRLPPAESNCEKV